MTNNEFQNIFDGYSSKIIQLFEILDCHLIQRFLTGGAPSGARQYNSVYIIYCIQCIKDALVCPVLRDLIFKAEGVRKSKESKKH